MAKIVFAEDSRAIREAVTTLLQGEFHSVMTTGNGRDVFDLYLSVRPDLIILDVMMPGKSGLDVCRDVRVSDSQTPIMFLSAKSSETDKVLGLGLGADDYVTKPFGTHEFLARVNALLRRTMRSRGCAHNAGESFRIGAMHVLPDENTLITSSGERIALTNRECTLLKLFRGNNRRIVSKEEIADCLWGDEYDPNSRTLAQHVCNLRRKVEHHGLSIVTIPRRGLKLEFANESFRPRKHSFAN